MRGLSVDTWKPATPPDSSDPVTSGWERPAHLSHKTAARPTPDDHPARMYRLGQQARFTWANGDTVVGRLTELHPDRVEISRTREVNGHVRYTRHRCILEMGVLEVPDIVEHPDCTHERLCPIHGEFTCPPTSLRPGDTVVMPDVARGAWGVIVALRVVDDPRGDREAALVARGDVNDDPHWLAIGAVKPAPTGFAAALNAVRVK